MKKLVFSILTVAVILLPVTLRGVAHPTAPAEQVEEEAERASAGSDVMRILVLGCDRSANLTDSMLVVALDRASGSLSVLQIPRDTYAAYTDRAYRKLNGALNLLGEEGLKGFLSEILGVKLHRFVILNLDAFSRVVDAVGGVDVDIPQEMVYSDPAQGLEIRLPAGQTHLNGEQAEQFVRYRSGYADADLGRLDAQKQFLRGFFTRCRELGNARLLGITCSLLTDLQTDLTPAEVRALLLSLRQSEAEEIPMATLAGQAAQGESGAWYYCVNRAGGARMVREYLLPSPDYDHTAFDPRRLLDRRENGAFHHIYEAAEEELPIG